MTGYSWFKGTSTLKLGLDFVHLNSKCFRGTFFIFWDRLIIFGWLLVCTLSLPWLEMLGDLCKRFERLELDEVDWEGDGVTWEGDGVAWEDDGVAWEGDGIAWEYIRFPWLSIGVSWENCYSVIK